MLALPGHGSRNRAFPRVRPLSSGVGGDQQAFVSDALAATPYFSPVAALRRDALASDFDSLASRPRRHVASAAGPPCSLRRPPPARSAAASPPRDTPRPRPS